LKKTKFKFKLAHKFIFLDCGSNTTKSRDAGEFSSISLIVNKDSSRRCTANVISPVWAITSAACVGKPDEDWVLIAGNTELNMSKISKDSVISLVSDIVTFSEVSKKIVWKIENYTTFCFF
jgi:hypothetical protein